MTESDFMSSIETIRTKGILPENIRTEFCTELKTLLEMVCDFYTDEIPDEDLFDNIVLDFNAVDDINNGKKLDSREEISNDIKFIINVLIAADLSQYFENGWRSHIGW